MKEQKKLEFQMFTLFLIVFIFFGIIVVTVKMGGIMIPKIEKKLTQYIKEEYKEIENDLKIGETTYIQEKSLYQVKVSNKINRNLYFFVNYKNKKITSTYQKDYIEGESLFNELKTKYEEEITKNTDYQNTTITFPKKLNQYTKTNQEKIIMEDTKLIPIYQITTELEIKKWDTKTMSKKIKNYINDLTTLDYNPKEYTLIISNEQKIDQIVKIEKLTKNLIETDLDSIIDGIIEDDKSIIKKYNINYQYTN